MTNYSQYIEEVNKNDFAKKGSGGFYDIQDGSANKIRILTEPVAFYKNYNQTKRTYETCYEGCGYKGTPYFLVYIWDKLEKDEEVSVKLFQMKFGLFKQLADWQATDDWKFDSMPMPFDINITKKGQMKDTTYTYSPSIPNPIPENILTLLRQKVSKTPCENIVEKMKENQIEKHKKDGTFQANLEKKERLAGELSEFRKQNNLSMDQIQEDFQSINPDDIPFD